jgi:hypothetical protein
LGKRAAQRGQGEQAGPEHVHPAAPEEVREPPAQEQEAPEHEDVAVHDPGQLIRAHVQVAAHRGKRDVDDRGVQDEDELGCCEKYEGECLL